MYWNRSKNVPDVSHLGPIWPNLDAKFDFPSGEKAEELPIQGCWTTDTRFGLKLGQIGTKFDKSWTFKTSFLYILTHWFK